MTDQRELTFAVTAVVAVTLVSLAPAAAGAVTPVEGTAGDGAATAQPPQSAHAVGELAGPLPTDADSVPDDATAVSVVLLAGYSRWDDSDPLAHETRDRLLDTVEDSPGVSLSTVADRPDAARSTVRYHYRILEREDVVEGHKLRGRRCLFPVESQWRGPDDRAPVTLSAALRDDSRRDVLRGVYRTEPVSVSDLATELDLATSTASHHLRRLAEDNLVERESAGRSVLVSLTPATRAAVERVA